MTQDVIGISREGTEGAKAPYVSIIIPVYNTEKQLEECLISAVFQTLPETEVIVVNDASPDGSQRIIDRFVKLFPDKVRCVVHDHNQGLSAARLTGVRNARAPYVVFLDSDDFISGKLCKTVWEENAGQEYDVYYFASDWVDLRTNQRRTIIPPRDFNAEVMVRKGIASFWSGVYSRDFLLAHQEAAFRHMRFEDAAAMPVLIGLAQTIGARSNSTGMYFYNTSREGSITTERMTRHQMEDLFQADVIPWENITEVLRPALAERLTHRAVVNFQKFPEIYDYCVCHIQHLLELTRGYKDDYRPEEQELLEEIRALPEEIRIPKRVYVNGFMWEQVRDFDRYLEQAARAYLFDPEVVVLDESTCDMASLPAWLRTAPAEDQGVYFALRRIGEEGGVYVSPAVTVTKAFNREAFSGAFFVAGPDTLVLPAAFGGEPGNAVIKSMVMALERGPKPGKKASAAEIMTLVLLGECGVHLNGKDEYGLHGLHMLHYKHVSREIQQESGYCELNYDNLRAVPSDAVVLPQALCDMAWEAARGEMASVQEDKVRFWNELRRTKQQRDKAEAELQNTRADRDRFWTALESTKQQRDKAAAELESARADRDRFWTALESAKQQRDKAAAELESARADRDRFWTVLGDTKQQRDNALSSLENTKRRLKDADSALKNAEAERDKTRIALEEARRELERAKKKNRAMKKELSAMKNSRSWKLVLRLRGLRDRVKRP